MPDHRMTDLDGDETTQYVVTSNVPVRIHNPQRKARLIAAAWIAALLMCSLTSGYVASLIAVGQNDDAKRQLRSEIEQRSRERDRQNERLRDVLDEYRQDQCRVTAKLPQDPDITGIRSRYRCTNPVAAPASSAPPSSAPGPGAPAAVFTYRPVPAPPRSTVGGTGAGGVVPRPAPQPQPQPQTPAPQPQPPAPVPVPPLLPPPGPLPQPLPTCVRAVVAQICLTLESP